MAAGTRAAPTLPYALLGVAQVAVGAAAIFARFALTGAQPLAVCAARLALAAALLLAAQAAFTRTRERLPRGHGVRLLLAGVALAVHFAMWIWSLDYLSVGVSTLLVATTPMWTAVYDALRYRARPNAWAAGAFCAGGCGIALVVAHATGRPPLPGHALLGSVLALGGAISIGAYFIAVRDIRTRVGTRTIVTRTYAVAAVLLVAAALVARQPPPPVNDGVAWGGIAGMALVSQLVGHTALNASLRWFSASTVAFTTLLEPVCAAALGWAILRERLSWETLAGGAIVLGAVAVVLWDEARNARNMLRILARSD